MDIQLLQQLSFAGLTLTSPTRIIHDDQTINPNVAPIPR